jgi:peptide/nickel transport system substrate-binding protein
VPRGHQFPEYGAMFNPDRPMPDYDPERAEELLEESGYEGEPIVFRVSPFYYTNGLEVGAGDRRDVACGRYQRDDRSARQPIRRGAGAIMVTNWSNSSFVADPDGALWLRWGADYPGTQRFFWYPEDPRFNELGAQARSRSTKTSATRHTRRCSTSGRKRLPGTVLYIPHEIYGMRDGVDWLPYSFFYMDLRPGNLRFE